MPVRRIDQNEYRKTLAIKYTPKGSQILSYIRLEKKIQQYKIVDDAKEQLRCVIPNGPDIRIRPTNRTN